MSCDIAYKAREILANPASNLRDFCGILQYLIIFFEQKFLSDVIEQYDDLLYAIKGLVLTSCRYPNIIDQNIAKYAENYMKKITKSSNYASISTKSYKHVGHDHIIYKLAANDKSTSRKKLLSSHYSYDEITYCRKISLIYPGLAAKKTDEILFGQALNKQCSLIIFIIINNFELLVNENKVESYYRK